MQARKTSTGELGDHLVHQTIQFGALCRAINRQLSEGIKSERILEFLFDFLSLEIPFDRIGIAVVDEDPDTLRLCWVRSKLPVQYLRENYSAPIKSSSLKQVFDTGRPRIINDLRQYAAQKPSSVSTQLILRDGIRSNLTCPLKTGNRIVGVVFFSSAKPDTYNESHVEAFQDISDEIAVIVEQARLRHLFDQERSRSLPLSRIIHDLRSPLTVIHAYLDMAARASWFEDLRPEVKRSYGTLKRQATFMVELLRELGELRGLDEGKNEANRQAVNLREFMGEVFSEARALCEGKDMQLSMLIDKHVPETAQFNPVRIRRVLDNLLSNAVKFSPRGTKISLSLKRDGNRVVFSVQDEGPGIPANEISLLFSDFGKTSVRPTEGESSTGLGLAIAKRIVKLHGGDITVESTPGSGSKFEFWLPVPGLSDEVWEQ